MKKVFLYSFALVLAFVMSIGQVAAQELVLPVEIPELNPKIIEVATKAVPDLLERPDKATNQITKAIKLAKNDKGQLMALAMWFTQQENGMQAAKYVIDKVYETNASDIDVMLVAGDIYGTMGLWGRAGQKYDQVLEIDTANIYALTQGARIYKNHNADASLAMWERLLQLEPNNTLAMRNIGDLVFDKNYLAEAVKYYGQYYDNVPHTKATLNAASMEKYLIALFYTEGQDARLMKVGSELYEVDPNDLAYQRFAFYGTIVNYDSVPATLERLKRYASYVTENRVPDSLLIANDYRYAYQLSALSGDYGKCVGYLTRAVDAPRDAVEVGMLKNAAFNLSAEGQNEVAAEMYQAYNDRAGEALTTEDMLMVVVLYRQALYTSQDAAQKAALKDKALSLIEQIEPKFDDASKYQLMLERAHIVAGVNGENSVEAIQAYEKALESCKNYEAAGESVKNVAIKLMLYYVNALQTAEDEEATWAKIRKYCDIVLNIEPFNETALDINEVLIQFGK